MCGLGTTMNIDRFITCLMSNEEHRQAQRLTRQLARSGAHRWQADARDGSLRRTIGTCRVTLMPAALYDADEPDDAPFVECPTTIIVKDLTTGETHEFEMACMFEAMKAVEECALHDD